MFLPLCLPTGTVIPPLIKCFLSPVCCFSQCLHKKSIPGRRALMKFHLLPRGKCEDVQQQGSSPFWQSLTSSSILDQATLPGLCSLSVSVPVWVNSLHFRESPKALPCATLESPWSLVLSSCYQNCTIIGVTADGYFEVSCLSQTQAVSHFCLPITQANFYLVRLCKRGVKANQLSSYDLWFG